MDPGGTREQHADEQAWLLLVDATLPEIWSTARAWELAPARAAEVCHVVLLALLDRLDRTSPEFAVPVTALVRHLTITECERVRRLTVWEALEKPAVITLTADEFAGAPEAGRPA